MQGYHKNDEAMLCLNRVIEWVNVTVLRTLDPYSVAITREMADDFDLHETYMTTIVSDVGSISACMMSGPENSITALKPDELDEYRALCKLVMKTRPEEHEPREPSTWPDRSLRVWEAMHLIADAASRKEIAHVMDISNSRVSYYIDETNKICAQFNTVLKPTRTRLRLSSSCWASVINSVS